MTKCIVVIVVAVVILADKQRQQLRFAVCSSSQHCWSNGCKNTSRFFYYDFETVSVGVGLKWDFSFHQGENSFYFHWREYL